MGKKLGALLVGSCLVFQSAYAAEKGGKYDLSAAGGVVNPSGSTSIFQNPAGLVSVPKLDLNLQGGWNSSFGNPTYKGGLLYGNNSVGVGGGVSTSPSTGSGVTTGFAGLALGIPSAKMSVGVSAFMGLSPSSSASFNAGLLFGLGNALRFGVTAIGLSNSISEWGGGVALDVNGNVTLLMDASANNSFGNVNYKPGILIGDQNIGVTASYGVGTGSLELANGFSAGGRFKLGNKIRWEVYYNQLSTIFTSVSIML